jgi:crotonobetainyl-CoA:carnitine CoA-transferase CaiB-like acyl-CoA transferase
MVQPRPAPRLSAWPDAVRRPAPAAGEHTDEVLAEAGLSDEEIKALREQNVVA